MTHRYGNPALLTRLGRASLLLSLTALGASPSLAGCADAPGSEGAEDSERLGSLGLHLNVAPDVSIDTVRYSIAGNGFSKSGSIDVKGHEGKGTTVSVSIPLTAHQPVFHA